MRTVERFEGLALEGTGTIGPVRLRTPAVLEARELDDLGDGAAVARGSGPSGFRRVVVASEGRQVAIDLPILAPEIVPAGPGVVPVEAGITLLHAPLEAEALRRLRAQPPELLILGNARVLWSEGEPLVTAVRAIRESVGAEPLLWGPRVALPHRLPLLTYLGFDLVDTTEGELRAAGGEFLDATLGPRPAPAADEERGCDCPACRSPSPDALSAHAREAYRRSFLEVRSALDRGTLRELVEARLVAEPAGAELLRHADRLLEGLLESRSPVTATGTRTYVLAESQRRPEMRRFRDRLVERYRPPTSKTVLLLLPCSRTKPYRRSPSHRRYARALEGLPAVQRVHVVSVSSPIGVVPRELEDVPPARHYDIPVTGDWSAEERGFVLRGLAHLLATGSYRHIVVHLDPEEYGFVHEAVPEARRAPTTVIDGRPTSSESIDQLRTVLARCLEDAPGLAGGPLGIVTEELRELASVQFGRSAAERLFATPLRLVGRPWFQRITDGRQDLASVREERGLFYLTVAGALRLGDTLARVDVDPGLALEGDLFAPGIVRADASVRAGDAVGLFQDGALTAVGEAVLPGALLEEMQRGLAVRVRHRRHGRADIAKTGGTPPPAGR